MAKAFAYLVVGLRFPLILGWAAAVVAAVLFLPPLPSSGDGLADLIPAGSAAAHADADATRLFGYPLEAGVAIVQRDPRDLPPSVVETTARAAVGYDRSPSIPGLLAVVPVPNGAGVPAPAVTASPVGAAGLLAGAKRHTSTIVTYLDFRPDATLEQQVSDARAYAARYLTHVVGVTGPVAAQYEQGQIINRDLGWVELFTVLAIALIVGVRFRSVLAPVAALACAGAAYVLATRIVAWGAQRTGIALPQDADPVLIVLLLGVTTDYCVFFLAGMRSRLAEGADRLQAVRDSTARSAPIVFAAGLIVAAGTGALLVARGGLLRAFGPGLAATVLVSMVVSLTLMPALLGVFGGLMFRQVAAGDRPTAAGFRLARLATSKPVALLVAAGCVAGLVLAASAARGLGLGSPLIGEMPPSSDVARAGAAASAGFAPGDTRADRGARHRARRRVADRGGNRLEAALRRQPGVASVVGPSVLSPASVPSPNPMVAKDGRAIRFALVYDTDPLNATAIGQVRVLTARLPALGRAAGLRGVRYEVGGQTALTSDAITCDGVGSMARRTRDHAGDAAAPDGVPARPAGTGLPAGGQRAGGARHARADRRHLRRGPRVAGPGLLRAVRGRSAAGLARIGLQRVRRRPDLGGSTGTAGAGRGGRRRSARLAGDHHRGRRAGRQLRPARADTAGRSPRSGRRRPVLRPRTCRR